MSKVFKNILQVLCVLIKQTLTIVSVYILNIVDRPFRWDDNSNFKSVFTHQCI